MHRSGPSAVALVGQCRATAVVRAIAATWHVRPGTPGNSHPEPCGMGLAQRASMRSEPGAVDPGDLLAVCQSGDDVQHDSAPRDSRPLRRAESSPADWTALTPLDGRQSRDAAQIWRMPSRAARRCSAPAGSRCSASSGLELDASTWRPPGAARGRAVVAHSRHGDSTRSSRDSCSIESSRLRFRQNSRPKRSERTHRRLSLERRAEAQHRLDPLSDLAISPSRSSTSSPAVSIGSPMRTVTWTGSHDRSCPCASPRGRP